MTRTRGLALCYEIHPVLPGGFYAVRSEESPDRRAGALHCCSFSVRCFTGAACVQLVRFVERCGRWRDRERRRAGQRRWQRDGGRHRRPGSPGFGRERRCRAAALAVAPSSPAAAGACRPSAAQAQGGSSAAGRQRRSRAHARPLRRGLRRRSQRRQHVGRPGGVHQVESDRPDRAAPGPRLVQGPRLGASPFSMAQHPALRRHGDRRPPRRRRQSLQDQPGARARPIKRAKARATASSSWRCIAT